MKRDLLNQIRVPEDQKRRPGSPFFLIFLAIACLTAAALWFAWPRASDSRRIVNVSNYTVQSNVSASAAPTSSAAPQTLAANPDALLVTSGYIITRERIELSPRFVGVVKWIGARKGDRVRKNDVLVLLDDSEQRARVAEADGELANARAALDLANARYQRIARLQKQSVESAKEEEESRLQMRIAETGIKKAEAAVLLAKTYLDWTIIRSPIDGVVLEKLVDENELVSPQSFGGDRGPSTALVALADPNDLQVEIDLSESEIAKVRRNQHCRISPEAYPDRHYDGFVAEIAPEAKRQKGTLQVKVQILKPDTYLTPELSAKVEFLKGTTPARKDPPAKD